MYMLICITMTFIMLIFIFISFSIVEECCAKCAVCVYSLLPRFKFRELSSLGAFLLIILLILFLLNSSFFLYRLQMVNFYPLMYLKHNLPSR